MREKRGRTGGERREEGERQEDEREGSEVQSRSKRQPNGSMEGASLK